MMTFDGLLSADDELKGYYEQGLPDQKLRFPETIQYTKKEPLYFKRNLYPYDHPEYRPDDPDYKAVVLGFAGSLEDKPDCGENVGFISCSCTVKVLLKNCGNLSCPTCYEALLHKKTVRINEETTAKMEAYIQSGDYKGPRTPKHVVFSCPASELPSEEQYRQDLLGSYSKTKRLGQAILKKAMRGFYAGVFVLHLYRFKHEDGSSCHDPDCTERHVPVWSPHFHFIGWGFLRKADDFEQSQLNRQQNNLSKVWKYHVIHDRGGDRDLASTVYYLLTHSSVVYRIYNHEIVHDGFAMGEYEKRVRALQSYSLVGALSNNFSRLETTTVQEEDICPKCSENRQIIHIINGNGVPTYTAPEPHFLRRRIITAIIYREDPELKRKWDKWWKLREETWGDLRTTPYLRGEYDE